MRVWPAATRWRTPSVAPATWVEQHRVDVEVVRLAVDADHRGARAQLAGEVGLVVAGRDEDQPVGAARGEGRGEPALPVGVLVDARGEDDDPARQGDVLHRPLDARRERVGDVVEQQPDRRRAPVGEAQAARAGVGPEAQLVDRRPDPVGQRRGHPRLLVHHARDGLEADPRQSGDVTQGRPPAVAHGRVPDPRRVVRSPPASARGWWCPPTSLSSMSGSLRNRDSD